MSTTRRRRSPARRRALTALALTLLATSAGWSLGAIPYAGAQASPSDPHPTLVPPDQLTTTTTGPSDSSTTTTTPPSASADPYTPPPVADARLSPALVGVVVHSPTYDVAESNYVAAWRRQVDATNRHHDADAELAQLGAAEQRLSGELNEATRRHDKSVARLAVLRRSAQDMAVASYVRSGSAGPDAGAFDPNGSTDARAAQVLVDAVTGTQQSDIRLHASIVAETASLIATDTPALAEVRSRLADTTGRRDQAAADQATAVEQVTRTARAVADTRMTAMVATTDLSLVALDAYWKAAVVTALTTPACHLRWQAIAGVGRVESLHGRYGGGPIDANGEAIPPIVGIALDGTNGTAAIPDSDGGTIDTDPVWDRAVGPMAFIPSSWRAFGRDGNGDGVKDVQNIYDAALATAGLLCRSGPLDRDANLRTAYFHYNQSQAYVDKVLGFTHDYDLFVVPPVPPTPPPPPA